MRTLCILFFTLMLFSPYGNAETLEDVKARDQWEQEPRKLKERCKQQVETMEDSESKKADCEAAYDAITNCDAGLFKAAVTTINHLCNNKKETNSSISGFSHEELCEQAKSNARESRKKCVQSLSLFLDPPHYVTNLKDRWKWSGQHLYYQWNSLFIDP